MKKLKISNLSEKDIQNLKEIKIIELEEMRFQDLKILKVKVETAIENMEKEWEPCVALVLLFPQVFHTVSTFF